MLSLKNVVMSLMVICAAGLTTLSIMFSNSKPMSTTIPPDQPDAIVENVMTLLINSEGKPTLKVSSPKMIHYACNNRTQIESPHVIVYRNSSEPWYIDADSATASFGITQIDFQNHVVIHHPGDNNDPMTTMQTNAITIFPDKKVAETNQAVTITQPATTIQAIGMLANFDNGTVKLLSQAKGEYVPSS